MTAVTGCLDDKILDAMIEERDFIEPYDIVQDDAYRTVYFKIPDTGSSVTVETGDDGFYNGLPEPISLQVMEDAVETDDIVEDNVTGLKWTRCSVSTGSNILSEAGSDTCSDEAAPLTWSDDWRLPRLSELFTILNFNKIDPLVDSDFFPNTGNDVNVGYWTATSKIFVADDDTFTEYGWIIFFKSSNPQVVDFGWGDVDITNIVDLKTKDNLHYARCVRRD